MSSALPTLPPPSKADTEIQPLDDLPRKRASDLPLDTLLMARAAMAAELARSLGPETADRIASAAIEVQVLYGWSPLAAVLDALRPVAKDSGIHDLDAIALGTRCSEAWTRAVP